jgi:type II secretory pathway component HofQ
LFFILLAEVSTLALFHKSSSAWAKGNKNISLNFNQAKTEQALKVISEVSGFNFVLTQKAKSSPPLTISLEDVSWEKALEVVLDIQNLKAIKKGNILKVYSTGEAPPGSVKRIYTESEIQKAAKNLEVSPKRNAPKTLKIYRLSYANPTSLKSIITEQLKDEDLIVNVDKRKNSLLINANNLAHTKIRNLIKLLDTPDLQIRISVKIVESKEDFQKTLGLGKDTNVVINTGPQKKSGNSGDVSISPNQGVIGIKGAGGSLIKGYNASLIAREREGKLKTNSTQELFTKNNQAVTMSFTTKQVYILSKTNSEGKTIPENVTIDIPKTLHITPKALSDGNIDLTVNITSSSQAPSDYGTIPDLESQNVNSKVIIRSGETIVLGSNSTSNDTNAAETGVPGARKVPGAGILFKSAAENTKNKRNYTVLITPQIIPSSGSKPSQ